MQFRDLKAQYLALKPQIDSAVQSVINEGAFILGKPVAELEKMLAEYAHRKHCITCASGTDALQLSLMAMGVGSGDAVFTSDFTYFASSAAASILGATVVFVDIDSKTFNISPQALERAIQKVISEGGLTPKVIIPVDLFGLPADYSKIIPIAEKYGLKVLEDAAQGFGSSIDKKPACSFGDISATSFFPAKPLGCYGDGGAVFVDDDMLNERIRSLRSHGKSPIDKYDNLEIGMNSRLDTIQAAVLIPKFKALIDYELEAVNKIAQRYDQRLCDSVATPYIPCEYLSCRAQYTITLKDEDTRNRVRNALTENKIPSMIYYPKGLHQQKAYESMNLSDELYPNTIHASKTVLSLPMHPYLSEEETDLISEIVKRSI